MPRVTRNFWIDLQVDGRSSYIGTGPRNKDGGFKMMISVREEGDISNKKINIEGICTNDRLKIFIDGKLYLETVR